MGIKKFNPVNATEYTWESNATLPILQLTEFDFQNGKVCIDGENFTIKYFTEYSFVAGSFFLYAYEIDMTLCTIQKVYVRDMANKCAAVWKTVEEFNQAVKNDKIEIW
jgi:hypothetical protein